jgi:hypothetical protein
MRDERPWRAARAERNVRSTSDVTMRRPVVKTLDQPGPGWATVLRRQPAGIVEGEPEGGYSTMVEVICCGDDPGLEYRAVSPELQRIRGLDPIAAGVTAYEQQVGRQQEPQAAHAGGTRTGSAIAGGQGHGHRRP